MYLQKSKGIYVGENELQVHGVFRIYCSVVNSSVVFLQGRRADLEMQQKQGKENAEELQYRQHCAWLW